MLNGVPRGAALVMTLDVRKLRASALGPAVLGESQSLAGVEGMTDACGFDPSGRVEELVLAAPGAGRAANSSFGDFGILAFGPFRREQISACAATLISRRGASPGVTQVGSFTSVRNRAEPDTELAVRDGGPVLIGQGAFFRELIDVADGRAPGLDIDDPHRKLRGRLGSGGTFVATLALESGWLERLAGSSLARLSPLSTLRTAAVRVDVGERLEVRVVVACAAPEPCAETALLFEQLVQSELSGILERELGPDGPKRIRIEARSTELEALFWLDEREASAFAGRAIEALTRPAEEPRGRAPLVEPDEIVRPP